MLRTLFAALGLVAALVPPAAAQSNYSVPRTPWGEPDIQGLWPANDMQGTPYERPVELGTRATLTDAELAERLKTRQRQAAADAEQFVREGRGTGIGGPSHWAAGERGTPTRQTSLVVDPTGRAHPGDDRGGQEAVRESEEHLLLRFSGRGGGASRSRPITICPR